MRPSPFFIVACARSGTTLLRTMLDRHPELAIPPESHFIPRLWRRRRRYGADGRVDHVDLLLQDLERDRRFGHWELPTEAVRDEILRRYGPSPSLPEAIDATFHAFARRVGKSRWADKTPVYVDSIPLLASMFPRARFVHLVRDGRDVALSILALNRLHRGPGSPAVVWARRSRRGRRAGSALGQQRYLEPRYEDLVEDPERVLRTVCRFVELPFDPTMLQHERAAAERLPQELRWMHRRLALPPTKGLRDWRKDMPPRDVARFEAVAGKQLARLGYEVGGAPGIRDRIGAWSDVGVFVGRVVLHKARRRLQPATPPAGTAVPSGDGR